MINQIGICWMEGKGGQVKGNPSSQLTSTAMVDGVLYRFKLRTSESTITDSLAPKSSHYVDLSEYPPGTGNDNSKLHWDGSRVVSKVPRWAHEKYQNDPDPEDDTSPSETTLRDAADGGNRPALPTASAGERPCEDLVENPSPTFAAVASYDTKELDPKAEARGLNSSGFPFAYPYAYADPSASASDDYPGKYAYSVEDDGRVVLKVDECVAPLIKIGGIRSSQVIQGGVYFTQKVPEIVEVRVHGKPRLFTIVTALLTTFNMFWTLYLTI